MNRFNNNFNPSCQTFHTLQFHFLFHYLLPRVLLVKQLFIRLFKSCESFTYYYPILKTRHLKLKRCIYVICRTVLWSSF